MKMQEHLGLREVSADYTRLHDGADRRHRSGRIPQQSGDFVTVRRCHALVRGQGLLVAAVRAGGGIQARSAAELSGAAGDGCGVHAGHVCVHADLHPDRRLRKTAPSSGRTLSPCAARLLCLAAEFPVSGRDRPADGVFLRDLSARLRAPAPRARGVPRSCPCRRGLEPAHLGLLRLDHRHPLRHLREPGHSDRGDAVDVLVHVYPAAGRLYQPRHPQGPSTKRRPNRPPLRRNDPYGRRCP